MNHSGSHTFGYAPGPTGMKKRFKMKKIITILTGLLLMTAPMVFAEAEIISKGPLAGSEAATPLNWNSQAQVWKTGKIDAISADALIIDDAGYHWSGFGTRFCGLDGTALRRGNFSQGTEVTFVLASDRKTILTLIKGTVQEDN